MRVSPRDLKAVRSAGLVARYATLGKAVFVLAELPEGGTGGTSIEEPCRKEHWGLVLQGELTLHARRTRTFEAGTAFHIAPGPTHHFSATGRTVVVGFAPITEPLDESPEAMRARGLEVMRRVTSAPPRPGSIRVAGQPTRTATSGRIETEAAVMGPWLFSRSIFGRQSGYAESWCDLPHWGLVLDGSLVLHWEHGELELLGPGDVFHCPGGPPGHRIEVPDSGTIVDYTPIAALDEPGRRRAPRVAGAYEGRATAEPAAGSRSPARTTVGNGAVVS